MIPDDGFERQLSEWFEAAAPADAPAGLHQAVVARTSTMSRRRAWGVNWLRLPERDVPSGRTRSTWQTAWILLVVALIVIVGIGLLALGSSHQLLPVGPARNGLITYEAGGQVIVANADGTGPRQLTPMGTINTSPNFSPDGNRIAYWSKVGTSTSVGLWVMNSDGSDAHVVSGSRDLSGLEFVQAAWSPDSRQLAFAIGDYYSSTTLLVVGADGGDLHEVGGGTLSRSDPAWSPDGRLIAFRGHTIGVLPDADPPDPAIGIYVIAPDGTGQRKISRSVGAGGAPNKTSFGGPSVGIAPSWSPDGRSLVYATGATGHHRLVVGMVDGSAERPVDLPPGDDILPVFSPDGSQIAFITSTPGDSGAFDNNEALAFVVRDDGTGLVPLAGGRPVLFAPVSWSPDGRFVISTTTNYRSALILDAGSSTGQAAGSSGSVVMGDELTLQDVAVDQFPERFSWQRLAP